MNQWNLQILKISLDELDTEGLKTITKSIQNFKMATQTTYKPNLTEHNLIEKL